MRRSLLFIPANNPAMMQNATLFFADSIIFDLEDAVSISEKDSARNLLARFLVEQNFVNEVIIRINDLDTNYATSDLQNLVSDNIDTIMLPKALPSTLADLDIILSQIEKQKNLKKTIKVIPIIEAALSLLKVEEIASFKRVNGLLLGAEDLTKDLEVERTKEGLEILYSRSKVSTAAKAFKIDAIDTPFTDTNDEVGLIADIKLAKKLAFNAKACIHPNQVPIVNELMSPSKEAISWALKVLEASKKTTLGAFSLEGKMIDKPIIERSKMIIMKAKKFGLL